MSLNKEDKEQLEKNTDEMIDAILEIIYTPADYILESVEEKYSLVDSVSKSFKDISEYKKAYPYELYITVIK